MAAPCIRAAWSAAPKMSSVTLNTDGIPAEDAAFERSFFEHPPKSDQQRHQVDQEQAQARPVRTYDRFLHGGNLYPRTDSPVERLLTARSRYASGQGGKMHGREFIRRQMRTADKRKKKAQNIQKRGGKLVVYGEQPLHPAAAPPPSAIDREKRQQIIDRINRNSATEAQHMRMDSDSDNDDKGEGVVPLKIDERTFRQKLSTVHTHARDPTKASNLVDMADASNLADMADLFSPNTTFNNLDLRFSSSDSVALAQPKVNPTNVPIDQEIGSFTDDVEILIREFWDKYNALAPYGVKLTRTNAETLVHYYETKGYETKWETLIQYRRTHPQQQSLLVESTLKLGAIRDRVNSIRKKLQSTN